MAENETNLETTETPTESTVDPAQPVQDDAASELAKLKSEFARQKAALDKATKEAGDAKKALRAKQTAEEIAQEELKAQTEARDKELDDLRRKFAVMETSKSVISRIGGDEASSTKIAEYLYGAADADGVLTEIQKIITSRESALRKEFGRIPAPGVGGSDGPTVTMEQLDAMSFRERVDFAAKHPDEYNKLMGR